MAAETSSSRAETSGTDGRFFKPHLHIERTLPISSIRLRYGDESGTSRPRPAPSTRSTQLRNCAEATRRSQHGEQRRRETCSMRGLTTSRPRVGPSGRKTDFGRLRRSSYPADVMEDRRFGVLVRIQCAAALNQRVS